MDGRRMLISFEELLRNTNPDLEFDVNINTDVAFEFLSRAQEEYIVENFIIGDSLNDQINAIRKRSDVLRNILDRSLCTIVATPLDDGGYEATITNDDYWMFLSGTLAHASLPTNDRGYNGKDDDGLADTTPRIELDLINHYDLQKKVRTVNNEPVYKYIPIVLEGTNGFVFYLDMEKYNAIGGSIATVVINITYLAHPPNISLSVPSALADSTHNDIVKKAVEIFTTEYKYRLGVPTTKQPG